MMVLFLVLGVLTVVQAAPNFQGKAITFIVPYSPGGGTDTFTRTVARHLGRFIPGKPRLVVRNMPGGGSVIGANYAWAAKPNGKTLLVTAASTVGHNLFRTKAVDFKLEQMHPIYSAPSGLVFFAGPKLVSKPEDIMTAKGIIFGHITPAGGTGSGFVWAKELLGLKTQKIIFGYGGSSAARGAYLQEELNVCGESTIGFNSAMKAYVERGEAIPIFQSGILDENGNVAREPAAPDVPTAPELYERVYGKKPTGLVWKSYKIIAGSRTYGKCILVPKDVPSDMVNTFRASVAKLVKDPKFLKDSERINPGAPHFYGKALTRNYPAGIAAPPDVVEFMKKILSEKYDVKFE
jgi:hypothetical protein